MGWKTVLKQTLPGSVLCVASLSAALEPLPGASAHFTVGSSAIYRSSLPEMVVLPTGHSRVGDLSCSLPPLFCAAYRHERPVRTVIISRPIAMSKYEVTFEDYDRFAEARASCIDYCGEGSYELALLEQGIATNHGQMPQRLRRLMTELRETAAPAGAELRPHAALYKGPAHGRGV